MTNVSRIKPKKKKIVRLRRSERLRVQIPIIIILTVAIIFTLIPFLLTFTNSLKRHFDVATNIFSLPKINAIMWSNYPVAFGYLGQNIWNSVFIAFVQSAVLVIISAIMAYIFAEVKFFGSDLLFYIYVAVMLLPNELNTPENYAFVYKAGLMNSYWAVWLPGWSSAQASGIFLLRIFFMGQPKSLKEAARIDGASEFYIYSRIIIPMLVPVLMVLVLFTFNASWNDFMWPSIAITTPKNSTITPSIQKFKNNFGNNPERFLAACTMAAIPTFFVYLLSQKYFLKGLQIGSGIKG